MSIEKNKKTPSKKIKQKSMIPFTQGLFPRFLTALKDRYHRVLQVIDEALDSENLKDRIWAVEQILKRTKDDSASPCENKNEASVPEQSLMDPVAVQAMSDEDLIQAVQQLLNSPKE